MPTRKHAARSSAASAPLPRVWHVERTDGLDDNITAHDCQILTSGALSFYKQVPPTPTEKYARFVLIRALSPSKWDDVSLVDTDEPDPADVRRS